METSSLDTEPKVTVENQQSEINELNTLSNLDINGMWSLISKMLNTGVQLNQNITKKKRVKSACNIHMCTFCGEKHKDKKNVEDSENSENDDSEDSEDGDSENDDSEEEDDTENEEDSEDSQDESDQDTENDSLPSRKNKSRLSVKQKILILKQISETYKEMTKSLIYVLKQ